jgi:hypothetical protein
MANLLALPSNTSGHCNRRAKSKDAETRHLHSLTAPGRVITDRALAEASSFCRRLSGIDADLLSNHDDYFGESLVGLHSLMCLANVARWKGIAMIFVGRAFCKDSANQPCQQFRCDSCFQICQFYRAAHLRNGG